MEHSPQPLPVNMEQIIGNYALDLYAALQEHAPKPYTAADIRRSEYEEDRMRGYNDALDEFWTVIRGVFGQPEPEEPTNIPPATAGERDGDE